MYIAKGVLSRTDMDQVYGHLMGESIWNIGGGYANNSDPLMCYTRAIAMDDKGMHSPFIAGYFVATLAKIREKIEQEYGFVIPSQSLATVAFNAQRKGNIPLFHTDGNSKGPMTWSAVGFLTPQWDESWGGELQIEDKTFVYEPGDFVVFRSDLYHDALPIKVDTPFWRVSVALMMQ